MVCMYYSLTHFVLAGYVPGPLRTKNLIKVTNIHSRTKHLIFKDKLKIIFLIYDIKINRL